MSAQIFLGIYDIVGAFLLVWANQRITGSAGFRNKASQWALLRRVAYLAAAFSLFCLGIMQLFNVREYRIMIAAHIILVTFVLMFPWLRAIGLISQDMLTIDDRK